MSGFQIVVLWSDMLIWLLVAAGIGVGLLVAKTPPLLAAWRRVGANRVGMASATVLLAFIAVGLLDSLHFRLQLDGKAGQKASYAVEVLSVLDVLAAPLRTRNEKPIPNLSRRGSTPRKPSTCPTARRCATTRA